MPDAQPEPQPEDREITKTNPLPPPHAGQKTPRASPRIGGLSRLKHPTPAQLQAASNHDWFARHVVLLKDEKRASRPRRIISSLDHSFHDKNMSGLFGGTTAAASNAATATQGSITNDIPINNPPEDSIQDLSWSPQSNHLSVASWDNKVRIYEINGEGQSAGKALIDLAVTDQTQDGTKVFAAGANKQVSMLDLGSGSTTPQVTIKYWDLRQQTPAASVQCKERVYAMDTRDQLLVVATADRWVEIFNLNQPSQPYKQIQSPLKWQTRTISCFADATGFAIGSIEGRCAIQYCHRQNAPNTRDQSNVYSVNSISFHPVHGTFSTAGSDGTFHFWDKDAKHRLKGYPEVGGSISCTDFSHDGNIFAYAVMLHPVIGDECKPRPNSKKR
ncbi:unnamed protein product [Aureobasidium pullulans]|nr:unnamed protein product [Aureobasidium pullulans]